jgi:uncharacterized protein YlxW (UPF0749 family)
LLTALAHRSMLMWFILIVFILVIGRSFLAQMSKKKRSVTASKAGLFASASVRQLEGKLNRLAGNRSIAQRLLKQLKIKYPGKSAQWYYEKAIYDLERDRRV